jgi:hypothetical protein
MRYHIPCTALGLALAAAAPAAHAQTVITRQVVGQPVETVRTVTTTRTVQPITRRRVVTTRRTVVTERVVPAAPAVVAAPPLYDIVAPPPAPDVNDDPYDSAPLYDTVVQTPAPVAPGPTVPFYRYVYQPDRILVIDPATGIAIEALPR